jgi:mono/diheme cytochrome c family protein
MFRPLAGALFLAATVACADAADTSNPDGAAAYQRCAACHLPGGEGIPGAFPPLKGRIAAMAASEEGRAYLVAVIQGGLMGSITVNGTPYMGVMPAQGASYDAQDISQVLNYAVQVIDSENVAADWAPFTADEVTRLLAANPTPTTQGSATLRQALLEQHPELK